MERLYLNHLYSDVGGWLGGRLLNVGWETVLPWGFSFTMGLGSYGSTLNLYQTFYHWRYLLPKEEELASTGLVAFLGFASYLHPGQLHHWFWGLSLIGKEINAKTQGIHAWGVGVEFKLGYRFLPNRKKKISLGVAPFIAVGVCFFGGEQAVAAWPDSHTFRSNLYGGSFPGKYTGVIELAEAGLLVLQARVGLDLGMSF